MVLGYWYHVWDLLGDLDTQVTSFHKNCSRFDWMVVSWLLKRQENSFESTVSFCQVVEHREGQQTTSVIFRFHVIYHHRTTVTSKCILWNIRDWGVFGTRLLILRFVSSWWLGRTITLFLSKLSLVSNYLSFIIWFSEVVINKGIIILRKSY